MLILWHGIDGTHKGPIKALQDDAEIPDEQDTVQSKHALSPQLRLRSFASHGEIEELLFNSIVGPYLDMVPGCAILFISP